MAWLVQPLVGAKPLVIYHWTGGVAALFGPAALSFSLVWAVITAVLLSARDSNRWRIAVWAGIVVALPWIVLRTFYLLWPDFVPHWVHLPHIPIAFVLWLAIVISWRPAHTRYSNRAIEFIATVLAFAALPGVLLLAQFSSYWWKARSLNHIVAVAEAPNARPVGAPSHRIIWIVLDELSYQQVYEHRYPGLQLPAFDALAASAVTFTHTIPEGVRTERVIPSLFTGTPTQAIRASPDGQLSLLNRNTGTWQHFQQHNSVFQDALNAGYRTGLAGWYNPYCRILPEVIDQCSWNFGVVLPNGLASDGTFGSNLASVASHLVGSGTIGHLLWRVSGIPIPRFRDSELHVTDYRNLFTEADRLLEDRSTGFVVLHLPIPHPGGIYNRATEQLTTGRSTYIDNLALADRYLAHVRSLLEQTGQWDSSNLVIMGDHSWRTTLMWKSDPRWTPEEQRASFGGFDSRPAYIVKLAGQQKGRRIDVPFAAVRTRKLMDALFDNSIQTPQDLQNWVSGTGRQSPAGEVKSVAVSGKKTHPQTLFAAAGM